MSGAPAPFVAGAAESVRLDHETHERQTAPGVPIKHETCRRCVCVAIPFSESAWFESAAVTKRLGVDGIEERAE